MSGKRAVISINACWNIFNFRRGLIRGLQQEGMEVIALAPADAFVDRLTALGVRVEPIEMNRQGVSPIGDGVLLLRYWSTLRRLKPDVYLGYTAKPNIYGSLAAHALGIPVINNVAGLGTAFIRRNWLTRVVKALYRLAFSRSYAVFFQNDDDRDLFVEEGIVDESLARRLPGSGIDLQHFSPAPPPADPGFTFLFIGRLLWDKGVGEFVEAARRTRAELPEARFQLLGAVDAPNRTAVGRLEVERWVEEGLVEYLGETDDIRPFMAAADCVVLPSYREGLPRVLLEGAAMARPLIATDVPGCRAVVEHDVNGFLCTVRDASSLADAMLRMARLPQERRVALGNAGRSKVEAGFAEQVVVDRYMEAVREALL